MFFVQKMAPLKTDFGKNFKIDKNPINTSYVRILAKLDHFCPFFSIYTIQFGRPQVLLNGKTDSDFFRMLQKIWFDTINRYNWRFVGILDLFYLIVISVEIIYWIISSTILLNLLGLSLNLLGISTLDEVMLRVTAFCKLQTVEYNIGKSLRGR